eukprot:gene16244-biopygen7582
MDDGRKEPNSRERKMVWTDGAAPWTDGASAWTDGMWTERPLDGRSVDLDGADLDGASVGSVQGSSVQGQSPSVQDPPPSVQRQFRWMAPSILKWTDRSVRPSGRSVRPSGGTERMDDGRTEPDSRARKRSVQTSAPSVHGRWTDGARFSGAEALRPNDAPSVQ